MKRILLLILLAQFFIYEAKAQVITDTVSVGAGYANQIWYSLENDNQGTSPKNNWDLAFDVSSFGSSIMINSATGTTLWCYPNSDKSGWATLDTAGIKTWATQWNTDTSWTNGALARYVAPGNPFDLGWGIYSTITHFVTGDSIYVIKLASGTYKKLWVQQLAGGIYTFQYADLDGNNLQNASVDKASYSGKNLAYYSLQNNTALDREPLSANWDLTFTQYTTFLPTPYTVTGVLSNKGVRVAKVDTAGNPTTYNNWNIHNFKTAINEIGYDWKTFTGVWAIKDSLLYFVKTRSGDVWKIIFTEFGGSSNGNFIFTKEQLNVATGITDATAISNASLSVYPNPSNGGDITILYDFENTLSSASLAISDLSGKIIYSEQLTKTPGFYAHNINTNRLSPGLYIVCVELGGNRLQQKLIIQ